MFRVVASLACVLVMMIEAASAQFGADADAGEADGAVVGVEQLILSEQEFDQFVFGGSRTVTIRNGQRVESVQGGGEQECRKQFEQTLVSEIQTVDQACSLSDAQKKKLQLAGRGDIARWFQQVNELRQKCTGRAMSPQQYNEAMLELQPFRWGNVSSFVGERSLFRKTLRRTLDEEQRPRLLVLEEKRKTAAIEGMLLTWERTPNGIKLKAETRREFINALLRHGRVPHSVTPYQYYVVILEASRIEEHLQPLLNEAQWKVFQLQVNQTKRVEPTLRKSGLWPVQDDDESSSETSKK